MGRDVSIAKDIGKDKDINVHIDTDIGYRHKYRYMDAKKQTHTRILKHKPGTHAMIMT